MSDMPVNLTNLRTITDGDIDTELLLFEQFKESANTALQTMQENCVPGFNEAWRRAAHALKGTAYNLGAENLGNLCKHAQENAEASETDKAALLSQMKLEYAGVIAFLDRVHA